MRPGFIDKIAEHRDDDSGRQVDASLQESESEGGRHSRNSNIQHLPSRSGNYEAAAPFLEVAQKLSSHISGRLSLDPPRKRAKTASPLHSVAAGGTANLPESRLACLLCLRCLHQLTGCRLKPTAVLASKIEGAVLSSPYCI